jgi:hypothetical protein
LLVAPQTTGVSLENPGVLPLTHLGLELWEISQFVQYEAARSALVEARSVDEVKDSPTGKFYDGKGRLFATPNRPMLLALPQILE